MRSPWNYIPSYNGCLIVWKLGLNTVLNLGHLWSVVVFKKKMQIAVIGGVSDQVKEKVVILWTLSTSFPLPKISYLSYITNRFRRRNFNQENCTGLNLPHPAPLSWSKIIPLLFLITADPAHYLPCLGLKGIVRKRQKREKNKTILHMQKISIALIYFLMYYKLNNNFIC